MIVKVVSEYGKTARVSPKENITSEELRKKIEAGIDDAEAANELEKLGWRLISVFSVTRTREVDNHIELWFQKD